MTEVRTDYIHNDIKTNDITKYYSPMCEDGIKILADEFNLPVSKFISNCGISPSIFERAFSKGNLPQLKHLLIVADHYNVTLDELLNRRLK